MIVATVCHLIPDEDGDGKHNGERERKRERKKKKGRKKKKYGPGLECLDFKFPLHRGRSCGALTAKPQGRPHRISGEVRETTAELKGGNGNSVEKGEISSDSLGE